ARDLELDVDVALKQLRPELAARADAFERFRKELLLARSVSSPHVVRIHDLVRHEQTWLISMDFVPGRSLERLLQDERLLTPDRALAIARHIALGLSAAHGVGVVHRDLKPANILIDDNDLARITDFGVARAAGDTGITGSGVVIGTPEYLSPEQARAEPLDGRSDLYALGLILYEMLTGTLPFRGGTPAEMMIQRVVQSPPRADTVKPGLPDFAVELCARLLAIDPKNRLPDAEAVILAIDSQRLGPRPPGQRIERPNLRLAWLASALVLGLAIWWVSERPSPEGQPSPVPNLTPANTAAPLDLLVLPWSVVSDVGEDSALATAIGYELTQRLTLAGQIRTADPARVERLLDGLGFDGAAADRQHDR
ncbi:MAG: serine/threonine protein kinase, partial [Xanthomonadales bacterium]|nr:serine/threonine protein kinase [Xanthomonadales bacterium]